MVCGPHCTQVTIGDGGNAEGPTRSHVDEAIGNKTFCDITLSRDGSTPNALYAAGNSGWGDQPYGTRVSGSVPAYCVLLCSRAGTINRENFHTLAKLFGTSDATAVG